MMVVTVGGGGGGSRYFGCGDKSIKYVLTG
jgi:hypothetical protein